VLCADHVNRNSVYMYSKLVLAFVQYVYYQTGYLCFDTKLPLWIVDEKNEVVDKYVILMT